MQLQFIVVTTGKSMTVNSGVPISLISIIFTADIPSAISSTLTVKMLIAVWLCCPLVVFVSCLPLFHRKLESTVATCRKPGAAYVYVNLSVFSILLLETDSTFPIAALCWLSFLIPTLVLYRLFLMVFLCLKLTLTVHHPNSLQVAYA